ncbi:hypothetical protein GGI22_003681 [Coemansia erecta]|nr:hypothetical protein GGI22_003681 [Coemansia erecta]
MMYRFYLANLTIAGLVALSAVASGSPLTANRRTDAARTPRIIGGTPVSSSDFKFIAYIESYMEGVGAFSCTGSLIAPNVVLTAGHCTYATDTTMFAASQIQVGFTHTRPPEETLYQGHSVATVITHPQFSMGTMENDIALLILADTISTSEASLAKVYNGAVKSGSTITAAGFGVTDVYDQNSVPTQLMEVDLKTGTTSYCKSIWPTYDAKTQICTDGTAGKDTCQGDSGGPVVTSTDSDVAILGITSFGPSTADNPYGLCAQAGGSGYYTRVSAFVQWIAKSANLNVSDFAVTGKAIPSDVFSDDNSTDTNASNTDDTEIITDFTASFDETNSRSSHSSIASASVSGGIRTIAEKSISLLAFGSAIAAIAQLV